MWILYLIFIGVPIFYFLEGYFDNRKYHNGYVVSDIGSFQHRDIVEGIIGRKLEPGEVVHHINGKRNDNRISNLALMSDYDHRRWHQKLSWMYSRKMFPSIQWQKKDLVENFNAILFD